jgi:hypothetical protein
LTRPLRCRRRLDAADLARLHHPTHFIGRVSTLGPLRLDLVTASAAGPGTVGTPDRSGRGARGGDRRQGAAGTSAGERTSPFAGTVAGALVAITPAIVALGLLAAGTDRRPGAGRRDVVALLERRGRGGIGPKLGAGGLGRPLRGPSRPGLMLLRRLMLLLGW